MILSFKTKASGQPTGFVDKILAGTKIHTIREDKNHRWRPGQTIQFATGVRSKNYNQFKTGQCKSVQHIEIKHWDDGLLAGMHVYIDGVQLDDDQIEELATNDGFDSRIGFYDWFNKDFEGRIIHWTAFRY